MSSSFWRIAISALCPYTTLFRSKQLGYLSRDNFSRGAYMYAQNMPNGVVYPCPLPVQPTYVTQYGVYHPRSEEHTSELQSPCNRVCRLLLEKRNIVV